MLENKVTLFEHCYCTLLEIFIFVQKFNFDFPRKIVALFWAKTRENAAVFRLFSCWQLRFHEKNCQKSFG